MKRPALLFWLLASAAAAQEDPRLAARSAMEAAATIQAQAAARQAQAASLQDGAREALEAAAQRQREAARIQESAAKPWPWPWSAETLPPGSAPAGDPLPAAEAEAVVTQAAAADLANTAARFLARLLTRYGGDTALALGAYNAGPARVDALAAAPGIPETHDYIPAVLARTAIARPALAELSR